MLPLNLITHPAIVFKFHQRGNGTGTCACFVLYRCEETRFWGMIGARFHAAAYFLKGEACRGKGSAAEARSHYEEALARLPGYAPAIEALKKTERRDGGRDARAPRGQMVHRRADCPVPVLRAPVVDVHVYVYVHDDRGHW